ncbi:Sorbin and SH3 domain-containing protein 1 [Amphibalanus amphitrite]|uniref:Sorbin and SH3 domain-containing protein 1 n=1 Tax=Amphibalanus amphitrite TaxID=1232801 RepID=A0A6A4WJU8_AMPAM|nr:Sorbin and SH3 domain-containing protein 1 [Amphibalanus amphitrite]
MLRTLQNSFRRSKEKSVERKPEENGVVTNGDASQSAGDSQGVTSPLPPPSPKSLSRSPSLRRKASPLKCPVTEQNLMSSIRDTLSSRGVWQPGSTPPSTPAQQEVKTKREDGPLIKEPVWTPKSSPTLERKQYRPINYDSNSLERKKKAELPSPPPPPPSEWDAPERVTVPVRSSSLPRPESATVTLLREARQGHLPRGAQYLSTVDGGRVVPPRRAPPVKEVEGVGPTTTGGMPVALRSTVKGENRQDWYRRVYDNLHRQPQARSSYGLGGYSSEPDGGYEDELNPRLPSRQPAERYRGQPGRIEDYTPGQSSLAEQEAAKYWEEVMGYFDKFLDDHAHIRLERPLRGVRSAANQAAPPGNNSNYVPRGLDGYESDSTLVYHRNEPPALTSGEQRSYYNQIQRGGEVPLSGLRKPAPERPKGQSRSPVLGPPDAHDLSHATSASEETGYVSSASHSPPSRSASGSRAIGMVSAELVRRSSVTPDRLGGSLDRRRSGSSPSGDEAELALLRDTLLSPGAGTREDSPEGYRAGVVRLLRLSRRSAGFQQLKPNFQALQRLTETGPPAAELRQLAEGHVRSLLEQLEQQQRQRQQELQGAGDRSRASARWSGDVGLRFRAESSSPPDAGLSPHLPNQVQKPPRVRDIPDDGFRSLPSSSRLRRQRAMASMQYIPHRTVSEQLRSAAEAAAGDDGGMGDEGDGPPGARVRPIPPELRREARETSHRSSAPPSLSWDVSDARRKPLPTPRSLDEASGEAQVECNHRPEPDPPRRRRPSVKKMLLSGFSSLRRKFRSRSGSRKRKVENVVVVKLSENGAGARVEGRERRAGNEQRPTPAPVVETKVMKVDAATSTIADTNVKRVVDSTHRVRTVGHVATGPSAPTGRAGQPKSRRPPPEVSLIGQMFTSSPELAEVESLTRVWRQTGGPALRDEFRPVSNFSARTDGSAPGSSVVASTPVPPSESSDFSAVWRGPAEMDWSIHRPIGRYVPDAGPPGGSTGPSAPCGYRSLPRPRARRHPPPPTTGSLPRPVPRRTPCPCCTQPGGHRRGGETSAGDGASRSAAGPRYQEAAVNIHYRSPVRWEEKEPLSEDELRRRQEDTMRRAYEEARRRKEERQAEDRESRRHGDNFTPSQKSPIPLDRYERLFDDVTDDRRPTLTASVLHEFRAQNNRELSLSRGETVRIRRKIDSNWYEGQKGTRIGIFPVTYVQVIDPRERSADRWSSRPQVRAKHRFSAQSAMELSLNKGDVVTILRRVDDNWYEGRRGDATGIFPASYVEPLTADHCDGGPRQKPVGAPAAHGLVMDGLSLRAPGERDQLRAPGERDQLRVDVKQNTMLYRVMFPYRHQNEDELDLEEGDMIQVLEQCPDGWYVGTNMRTGMFGTFPGNYTRRM